MSKRLLPRIALTTRDGRVFITSSDMTTGPLPFTYVREDQRRLVYVRAHRTLTAADVSAVLDRQIRDAAWSYGVLYDLRLTDAPTSPADLVAIANRVSELVATHGPRGPVAVVSRDDAMRALPEIHARHAGHVVTMEVFWSFAEAKQWLTTQWRAMRSTT